MREVKITQMTKEEYMSIYGDRYDKGELFDYPLNELDYVVTFTEIKELAIIGKRLYEIN